MRDLQSVLRKVRNHVTGFPTVRVTAVQTQEQLLREIQAISPNSLPGPAHRRRMDLVDPAFRKSFRRQPGLFPAFVEQSIGNIIGFAVTDHIQ